MATIGEEIEKYKAQVNQYDAGRPNNSVAPQNDGKFRQSDPAMNPASDRVSSAVGGAVRGISRVGESMSGTSGGVSMRGPEMRGNMPTTAQLQEKPFNYQQQPGARQVLQMVGANLAEAYDPDATAKFDATRKGFEGRLNMPVRSPGVSSLRATANGPVMPTQREQLLQDPEGFVPGDQKTVWPGVADAASRFAEGVSARAANAGEVGKPLDPNQPASSPANRGTVYRYPVNRNANAAQPGAPTDPSKNSWAGNYAAPDANGQGIFTDPATGRTSIRLTGEAGGKFMQDQNKIIADGGGKVDGRKAMPLGAYGGQFSQRDEIPPTARPGLTLRSTPVEYTRTASDAKVDGGFAASEEFTPQAAQPAQRSAMPMMTNNPIADQRNAEAALATRQREVMAMEKADKSLMQAPGSRDYISPTLTEPEQRARQAEIATQRKQDAEDVISGNVARATVAATNDMATGKTSDRNLAMIPYAERRAIINTRNGLMDNSASLEKDRKGVATADAERAAKEKQDVRKDATDRYVADSNTALAQTNAQVNAESKRLDREATMKAALLKLEGVKDPVQLEKLKGYNSAVEAIMAMGQTPTAEQLLEIQKTYGVADLFKPVDPYAKLTIPAPGQ